MQVATLSTYWSYLSGTTVLPLGRRAGVALAAAALAALVLVLRLRSAPEGGRRRADRQTQAA